MWNKHFNTKKNYYNKYSRLPLRMVSYKTVTREELEHRKYIDLGISKGKRLLDNQNQ